MSAVGFQLLAALTLLGFGCAAWITYRRLPHAATLLLLALLYIYTFHAFVITLLDGQGLLEAPPLFVGGAPYDVAVDEPFWLAIILLGLFGNAYLLALAYLGGPAVRRAASATPEYRVEPLLLAGGLSLVLAGAMWFEALRSAVTAGQSAYLYFKRGGSLGVWYPVSRVLFDVASMSIGGAVGVSLSAVMNRSPSSREIALLALGLLLAALLMVSMGLLGDRATIVAGFAFGVIIAAQHRVRLKRLLLIVSVSLVAINVISVLRERRPEDASADDPPILVRALSGVLITAESTVAYSMQTTLRYDIPKSDGAAVGFILEALVPRFLQPDRVAMDPYDYYADAAGLPVATGWGIHLATDLYINFGILGLIVGGIALGGFHASFFRQFRIRPELLFAFAGCVASFPIAFRAGIPGIKSSIIGLVSGYLLGRLASPGAFRESAASGAAATGGTRPAASGAGP